jgi:HemY protein
LFRARTDLPKDAASDTAKRAPTDIPPVIPILRAPDDPGIDDEVVADEFAEPLPPAQAGGWRGFLSRWGG